MQEKKEYKAPSVESIKIQEPIAYACNIYNAGGGQGTWSGPSVTNPVFIC